VALEARMNIPQQFLGALLVLLLPAAGLPHAHPRRGVEADPLVQGAEAALQAYTRASDAYTQSVVSPSVAFWSLVIAAVLVLLEWLVATLRPGR
jgi:hypothetical protein